MARRSPKTDPRIESLHNRLRAARDTADRAALYLAFAESWGADNPGPVLAELDAALLMSGLHNHPLAAAKLALARAAHRIHVDVRDVAGARRDVNEARNHCSRLGSIEGIGLMLDVAEWYEELGRFDEAVKVLTPIAHDNPGPLKKRANARDREQWERRTEMCAQAWSRLGNRFLQRAAYKDALEAHQQAYTLGATLERMDMQAAALAGLARVHAALPDGKTAADENVKRALAAAAAHDRHSQVARTVAEAFEQLAEMALSSAAPLNQIHAVGWERRNLRLIYQQLGDAAALARVDVIDGRIREARREFDAAIAFYSDAVATLDAAGAWRAIPAVLVAIGRAHRRMNQEEKALAPLRQAEKLAGVADDARTQRDALTELAHAHETYGNYRDAYKCFKRATAIAEALASEQHQQELARVQGTFDVVQAKGLEQRLTKAQHTAGRRRQEVRVATTRIASRTEYLRAQLRRLKTALRLLADDGRKRTRPEIEKMMADLQREIEKVVADLQQEIDADERHWHDMLARVIDVDIDWGRRLRERFPNLTAAEREVCCMELLGRTARMIAEARRTDIRTIYKQRQMIRRKTGCPSHLTIGEHVKNVCT